MIDDVTHFASVALHTLRVRGMPDMKSQLTNTASLVSVCDMQLVQLGVFGEKEIVRYKICNGSVEQI